MSAFSEVSLEKLSTCHEDLRILFGEVIKHFDCKVTEGFRGQAAQDKAFAEGRTEKKWPNGKHNQKPSLAIDVYPCPVEMEDVLRFHYFGGFVKGIAQGLKIQGKITHDIRWGGDWNNDTEVKDNNFDDLVHFEIIPCKI